MRVRGILTLLAVLVWSACSQQVAPDPASIIRPLYAPYLADSATLSAFEDAAPWSSSLRQQIVNVRNGALNFDPFVHAQDWRLDDLSVTSERVVAGQSASVRVAFKNFGNSDEVIYDLVWADGGWRIDNMHGPGWDLRERLRSSQ